MPSLSSRGGLEVELGLVSILELHSASMDPILLGAWYWPSTIVDSLPTDLCYAVMVYPWLQQGCIKCRSHVPR